jgi:hypothetical protein
MHYPKCYLVLENACLSDTLLTTHRRKKKLLESFCPDTFELVKLQKLEADTDLRDFRIVDLRQQILTIVSKSTVFGDGYEAACIPPYVRRYVFSHWGQTEKYVR